MRQGIWPRKPTAPGLRTALDLVIVLAVTAAVIAISAHAPSTTYAYAQLQQIGTLVGTVQTGQWLLPRDHMGGVARKPPLYAWMGSASLLATGAYNDFVFRLPTVAASLVMGVLVYSLGRRWFDRRIGLLAGCLWAVPHHMGKLMYVAVTDMMMVMWITASLLCADRLLFHRAPAGRRRRWAVGLWAGLILATLTKGPAGLVLMGAILAPAVALWPGFAALRAAASVWAKAMLACRLVGRRWWRAIKDVRLGWGMLACLGVIVPLLLAMLRAGGQEFRDVLYFEYWQRIAGTGAYPPHSASVPAALHPVYYLLPTSVFAVGALVLVRPRRWFTRRGPWGLALWWVVGVVVPFSLTHGFRPDYLLPCYPAVAVMAAWAVMAVLRLGSDGGRIVSACRHAFAAVAIAFGAIVAVAAAAYLLHAYLPSAAQSAVKPPAYAHAGMSAVLGALVAAGVVGVVLAVRFSLRWRIGALAGVAIVMSVGVIYLDTHLFCRHARTGDGERMLRFAGRMRPMVGDDQFATSFTAKLTVELYMGRFGQEARTAEEINALSAPWLVTHDRGLVALGAARPDPNGPTRAITELGDKRYRTLPGELGQVVLQTEPIRSQDWGRIYLVRLKRPVRVSGPPTVPYHHSGRKGRW